MTFGSVSKHMLWNILGQSGPILIAIVAIPLLVQRLGMDRYGFLTLVWVLIGYVGIFDFGVGRAMTRVVSERLGAGDQVGAESNARTALSFLLAAGLAIGTLLLILSTAIVEALSIPPALGEEALNAFRLLAFSLPFVMLTSGYRGYLEARREFGILNIVRTIMGMLTYGAPLVATAISPRLEFMVASVLLTRMIANYAHRWACIRCDGASLRFEWPSIQRVRPMLALGGWMTVSNVVSPLMGSVDRLLIAGVASVAAIGMYATAFDVVTKVLIVAYSLTGAAFPLFAAMQQTDRVGAMYATISKAMLLLIWPALFLLSLFAQPLFTLWMGQSFAELAAPAMQILAVGLLFNCLAQVPAMLIHSRGAPRWMAIMHLIEVPFFLVAIYFFTQRWGVLGTAFAWSLRAAIDASALFVIVDRRLARGALRIAQIAFPLILAIAMCALPLIQLTMPYRLAAGAGVVLAFLLITWRFLLDEAERTTLIQLINQKMRRSAK